MELDKNQEETRESRNEMLNDEIGKKLCCLTASSQLCSGSVVPLWLCCAFAALLRLYRALLHLCRAAMCLQLCRATCYASVVVALLRLCDFAMPV
ncbi:hypothetical protein L2E82_51239 [Cichorium intybus]|nr:hypothetical protein L2E82_51239 [Cichorium intybus]